MTTKTITIINTGNKALSQYLAEINLTATEYSFVNKLSGYYMNFIDEGVNLPYYIVKYDKANNLIKVLLSVNIPVNTVKVITLNIGVISISGKKISQVTTRKTAIDITKSLYKMDSIHDSLSIGADLALINSVLSNSQFGKVLNCNGVDGYATITRGFDCITTYDQCTISFNFALKYDHKAGCGDHCVFGSSTGADTDIYVQFGNDGKLNIGGIVLTPVFWRKFELHSITIRTNKQFTSIWFDDIFIRRSNVPQLVTTQPFYFGAYKSYAQAVGRYCYCFIWDIEFTQGRYLLGDQFARNQGVVKKQDIECNKWEFVADVPDTDPDNVLRQEPNIITVGTELHLYSTDREVAIPGVSRRVSTNNGVTWSLPVAVTIDGVSQNTQRPFVFQYNNKIYIIYQVLAGLAISESVNGIDFTNQQSFYSTPIGYDSVENSTVFNDNGIWYGVIEGKNTASGVWDSFVIAGATLTTMVKLYELESIVAGANSGPFLLKINGIWHLWVHSLYPSEVFRYTNSDITTDNWMKVYTNPIFTLFNKWSQEQVADISICEKDGICYATVNNSGDGFNTTGNNSIFKYDGTLQELVSDLSIAIT